MAQVGEGKGNMMNSKPMGNLAIRVHQQGAEFVNPGKTMLADEAPL
jgi:hypothetical protein